MNESSHRPTRAPVVVIGLGNPLMSDEGIGVRLADELEKRLADRPGVEVLDAGTGGVSVVHLIAGRRRVIFVDCAFMGTEPGTIRRFRPDEVRSQKARTRQSLHEGDLLSWLDLSRAMGECPEDIVIFGIEPVIVSEGIQLSEKLLRRLEEYVETIARASEEC